MIQRIMTIVLILVIVLGGGYYAYRQLVPPPEEEAAGPVYATQPVVRGDISVGVDATGGLNPSRGGGIQVPGGRGPMPATGPTTFIIDEVFVEEGDEVHKGQLLVKLSAPNLHSQIKSAEEQLEADREALADLLYISPDQLDRVDPSMGITLRAPIDGRVMSLDVTEGKELKQGQIVARVVDDSRFRLVAKLTPGEFAQVKKGQRVVLSFSQFDSLVEAEVVDINPNPVPVASSDLVDSQVPGGGSGQGEQYQFVYWVTIEGKNPGLVMPGMRAHIGLVKESAGDGKVSALDALWLRYDSNVESYVKEERILSRADAIATRVYVQEMEVVKAGDPLVALAGEDARELIKEKLDEIRQQERDLEQMRAQFNQLEIVSPMDGVVASIRSEPGQTVQPGEWLGHIYNTSDMEMWVDVDDVDVLLVQQGAPVSVTVDALPGKTFEGEVMHVATMGKDENGITRFRVNIRVKGSPELRPGMQAQAHIDAGSAENVLLVPLEAIFEEEGKPKVEILQPDGTTKVVPIELGLMNDRVAEVKSGLEEGQQVITGSTADLLPSQSIKSQDSLLPEKPNDNGQNGSGGNAGSPGAA